jgi:hypothetical protein
LAKWLYEAGIGECRAALVEDGEIVEACIEIDLDQPRPGSILSARLRPHRIAEIAGGGEALLDFVPKGTSEGASIRIVITREALPEPGKPKRAKARVVPAETSYIAGPGLLERISASGLPVTQLRGHEADRLEALGWSELLEQAATGNVPFAGGALRISLTPAMMLIDIDGTVDAATLAIAGAKAAAAAIRRFGIAGSIGIDLPTLAGKAERIAVAEAFDAALPLPFERTAVNGFGFLQVIRPRHRASLPELLAADPPAAAARALLRRAERSTLSGAVTLVAAPAIEAILAAHPDWLDALSRCLGGSVGLRADPQLGISGGYVERTHNG